MKIICKLFGHTPVDGYYGPGTGYFQIRTVEQDNVGVLHASLFTKCKWCGTFYRIGYVHLPKDSKNNNRHD